MHSFWTYLFWSLLSWCGVLYALGFYAFLMLPPRSTRSWQTRLLLFAGSPATIPWETMRRCLNVLSQS